MNFAAAHTVKRPCDFSLQQTCERLQQNDPSFTTLNLAGYDIGEKLSDATVILLAEALADNTTVKVLNLCSNNIGPLGATALFQSLQYGTSLDVLNLRDNHIGSGDGSVDALKQSTKAKIKKLVLTDNEIDAAGATVLAESLKHNGCLEVLYLGRNEIGDVGAVALGEALLSPECRISNLVIPFSHIGDKGVKGLAEGIENNHYLSELVLVGNNIGDTGALALAKGLRNNFKLEELFITANPIRREGLESLIRDGLRHNVSLEHLHLEGIQAPHLQDEKILYLRLNRAGRRLLQEKDMHPALWAHVFCKISRTQPDLLHFFVKAAPQIFP